MTTDNVDVVRPIYDAWSRGDFDDVSWADPSIEFVLADGLTTGTWTGLPAMARAWGGMLSSFEDFRAVAEEVRRLDDERVLVLTRNSGRGKGSGLSVESISTDGANLFTVRGGKVTRLVAYWDRTELLAQLEL